MAVAAPPRPPVLDNPFSNAPRGHVFVLSGEKRTLFGIHVERERQSRVLAFRHFDEAARFRQRLVVFHEHHGHWPLRVVDDPEELPLLTHAGPGAGPHKCVCPTIEPADLEALITRLFTNHILLDVVESLHQEHMASTTWTNELPLDVYRSNLSVLFRL
ncbi:MAG: hypothetical protein EOO40_01975 [Deltaproteobacteria bacterium]|nr:MAG: hypothetical protein EOO40_01975 [Deltaproteobacteria bacterium]